MIPRITDMKYVTGYKIWLKFEDGQEGEIDLESEIDPSVLGGAVIYAGDQVIDGSLLGRLRKLEQSLSH